MRDLQPEFALIEGFSSCAPLSRPRRADPGQAGKHTSKLEEETYLQMVYLFLLFKQIAFGEGWMDGWIAGESFKTTTSRLALRESVGRRDSLLLWCGWVGGRAAILDFLYVMDFFAGIIYEIQINKAWRL